MTYNLRRDEMFWRIGQEMTLKETIESFEDKELNLVIAEFETNWEFNEE